MKFPAYPKYKPSGTEWLGDVPEHWEIKRSDALIESEKRQVSPETFTDEEVFHYSIPAVQELGTGLLENGESIASSKQVVTEPVVLVSRLNPRKATICLAKPQKLRTLASTEFVALKPRKCDLRFLEYLVSTELFRQRLDSWVQSVTRSHQRASPELIYRFWTAWPNLMEQQAIAAFLDRETERIDRLVAKKRELIERLKEKRTALISRTVTRGLPPAAARAAGLPVNPALKLSGLNTISEIPSKWIVSKVWLERVACNVEYQDGNHGELHPKAEDYVDDGIPFVMANHLVRGQIDFENCNYIEPELAASLRIGFARAGDVLLTHKGTIGRVAMVQESEYPYVMLTPQVTYYRCLRKISSKFLFWFFQGKLWQEQMLLISSLGTTRGYVGLLDQRPLNLLLPPLPEQTAIATYLDAETAKLDALAAKVEQAVERLQEYRTALITAAVTGKIDVRKEPYGK